MKNISVILIIIVTLAYSDFSHAKNGVEQQVDLAEDLDTDEEKIELDEIEDSELVERPDDIDTDDLLAVYRNALREEERVIA